jgi:hypothetical protein
VSLIVAAIVATDAHGMAATTDPCSPDDLSATLFNCLGINPHQELMTPSGRPVQLFCLGVCFAGTANQRIEIFLADVVCNDSESYNIRRSAYSSLFMINEGQRMPPPELALNLRIPEDVDWTFVHIMRRGAE